MGMSTYVYGLRAPTELHLAMVQIREACSIANIDEPIEVERYFENQYGTDGSSERMDLPVGSVINWSAEMQNGLEIDLSKIPPDVIRIRFVNSY